MSFTDRRKHLYENMNQFNQLPEFKKDLKKLLKKYPSLQGDLVILERVLIVSPTGIGKNFTIIHCSEKIKLVKVRLSCKSLRNRSMRIIYAYHNDTLTFVYIELYFKGNKENENRDRVAQYLKSVV